MDFNMFLTSFMNQVGEDPRIGPSHISLFLAILHMYRQQNYKLPILAYSRELIKQAKISARTYHTCMADLVEYGYIRYTPSYNPVFGSSIYLFK